MHSHHAIRGLVIGAAAISLCGACTSGSAIPTLGPPATPAFVAAPTVEPTAQPDSDATSTATPTPTPSSVATPATSAATAITYGPVTVISGSEDCTIDWGTVTGEGTTVQHARDGTYSCNDTADDPRVDGTATATWNVDYWGTPDRTQGAYVGWGTGRLVGAGGAWVGRATAVWSSDIGGSIAWWWTGTDAYAGLSYFELVTGSGVKQIRGQVFPGSPPDPASVALPAVPPMATPGYLPTPTGTPEAIDYGPVSVFAGEEDCDVSGVFGTVTDEGDGHQHSRNGNVKCTDTVNEPRMNGDYAATWNMDHWDGPGNGALVQWGASRLNAGGSPWEGRATGVYSGDRGDIIVWWWTGTGKYAGLACFELVTGMGPWSMQGQIFPGSPPQL
jgi:hypothetical protein